jgi:hypothetical protein
VASHVEARKEYSSTPSESCLSLAQTVTTVVDKHTPFTLIQRQANTAQSLDHSLRNGHVMASLEKYEDI